MESLSLEEENKDIKEIFSDQKKNKITPQLII